MRRWGRAARWAGVRASFIVLTGIVFLLPLFFWPGTTEYNYARGIFLLVSISALAITHAASALHRKASQGRVPAIVLPLAGLLVAGFASLAGAPHAPSVLQSCALLSAVLVFVWLTADVVRSPRDVTILLSALTASAFLVATHAILQYAGLLPGTADVGSATMIASMGNADAVAGFLGYAVLPIGVLLRRVRRTPARAAVLVALATSAAAILLTGQRGVLLGLFAASIVVVVSWAALSPKPARRRRSVLALALVGLTAFGFLLSLVVRAPSSERSLIAEAWATNSGRERALFWDVGWAMWASHPLTGVGLGNYKLAYPEHKALVLARGGEVVPSTYVANAAQAHNDYLQLGAETGILGLLAAAALIAVVAASFWLRIRRNEEPSRVDLLLLGGGLVVYAVHAFFGFPTHLVAPAATAALLAAVAASTAYGQAASFSFPIGCRTRRAGLVLAVAAGLTVAVFAARDLAANVLQLRGTRQLQLGDAQASLHTLEASLRLDFAPRQTYFYLASAQYRLGRYQDALESLARCLTVFPDETAFILYGDLAAGLGDLDGALATIDSLLATAPSPAHEYKARLVRALILREKANLPAAESSLRELIAVSPTYEGGYIALGDLLAATARGDEARALYEQALALIEHALPEAREAADVPVQTYAQLAAARERLDDLTRERAHVTGALNGLLGP